MAALVDCDRGNRFFRSDFDCHTPWGTEVRLRYWLRWSPLNVKSKKHTAQCACGAVKFKFDADPTFVAVCHCLDGKKASGGEAATFFGVPEDDFTLISGEPKAFHYIAQSGKGLDRNFCSNCGARVFSNNLEGFPGMVFVTIGSLDNPEGIEPVLEMFTKRRLKWAKPLDLPQFENMPN